MEGFKNKKPHYSQGCDRLLARINDLETERPISLRSEVPPIDKNYWKNPRDQQDVQI